MELRQLRYFVALAEYLHFRRAAEHVGISQPALSLDIQKFEDQLGTRLFDRDKKSVKLTNSGQVLLTHAQNILRKVEDTESLLKQPEQEVTRVIRIGFVNAMLYRGLLDAAKEFQSKHPDINVSLTENDTAQLHSLVANKKLDVALSHHTDPHRAIVSQTILKEKFVAYIPRSHPLAGQDKIDLADLREDAFICFPRIESPLYYDLIIAQCVTAGFSPNIRHEAKLWHTILMMVQAGMGVAIVPETLRKAPSDTAVSKPLTHDGAPLEIMALRPTGPSEALVDHFIEELRVSMILR